MKKLHTVNWGIIGVGDVTEIKSGPAFYKIEYSNLLAVMRRNENKVVDYARRHKVQKWYTNATELINNPDIDAVYIATPPDSHACYAIEVMRAGKPVYVEKPMARSYAECAEMLEVSKQTGSPLWVAYYRRTLPAFLKARDIIESGEIGKPLSVNVRLHKQAEERNQTKEEMHWHVFPEIGGAGHFFDLASHQFDYLDFIFGKVTELNAKATNLGGLYPAEDTVSGTWTHESGVAGSGSWSFIADPDNEVDELVITAQKGTITLSCFACPETLRVSTEQGVTDLKFNHPEHISQYMIQQVVDELRGVGSCVSTGESAARTSWVLEQMTSNYYMDQVK